MPPYSLGSAALGSGVSGLFGLAGTGLNYLFQKKLASQQNQYNIDMWKMQADYNSPQQQMQRFAEAGLNPNLIYGQGSNGNMSQAPQMVTPEAPEVSKDLRELSKAFNIENLRTIVASRRKAEADADTAEAVASQEETEAKEAHDYYEAKVQFDHDYKFDPRTGSFVFVPREDRRIMNGASSKYYLEHILANNYYKGHLIPYRESLLQEQKNLLVPQVYMRNFDKQHYDTTFFIDRANKPAGVAYTIMEALRRFFGL